MPTPKCKECGKRFSAENDRVRYCGEHRRKEKPLRKIQHVYQCSICQDMLEKYVAGLGRLLDRIKEIPDKTAEDIRDSIAQFARTRKQADSEPTRYDRRVERLGWIGVEKIVDTSLPTMKSMIEMTGYSRTVVRRHLTQHLIPLGYLMRRGRRIEIGPKLGQGIPRYSLHFNPEKTRWLPPIGYSGFIPEDYEMNDAEFKKLNDMLKLASEELIVFWLRTRLFQLKGEVVEILSSEKLDTETKGVILYGVRLALGQLLKKVLSQYAPSLVKHGNGNGLLQGEALMVVDPTIDRESMDLDQIRSIADELDSGKSPLLEEQWASIRINEVVNFVWHRITFDKPTVIIEWKHDEPHRILLRGF